MSAVYVACESIYMSYIYSHMPWRHYIHFHNPTHGVCITCHFLIVLYLNGNSIEWKNVFVRQWCFVTLMAFFYYSVVMTLLDSTWFSVGFQLSTTPTSLGSSIARPSHKHWEVICVQYNTTVEDTKVMVSHHCTNMSLIHFALYRWLFSHLCFNREDTKSWSPHHLQCANSKL